MSLKLGRGETILYPMPYVEAERPPYVVTNQRLIERLGRMERTLQVKQLASANRARSRPHAVLGAVLLCIGLGVAAVGAFEVFSVMGMKAASFGALWRSINSGSKPDDDESDDQPAQPALPAPAATDALPDDPSQVESPDDAAWALDVLKTRLIGFGVLAAGALVAFVGLRVFRQLRYFVVCRTAGESMRVRVSDKIQQDLILATLQAVK